MPFEFVEHTADVGLRASGATVAQALCEAARGMFATMIDLESVDPVRRHVVRCRGDTLEDVLVEWLGSLLAQKDLTGMVFSAFEVDVRVKADGFVLDGVARGERLDRARHRPGTEVKGISYLGLSVREAESGDGWIAECVLDV